MKPSVPQRILTVWSMRRRGLHRGHWQKHGISYTGKIWNGFPPFDEARRKPLDADKLDQYHIVFHYRRNLRIGDRHIVEVIEKWQELMA